MLEERFILCSCVIRGSTYQRVPPIGRELGLFGRYLGKHLVAETLRSRKACTPGATFNRPDAFFFYIKHVNGPNQAGSASAFLHFMLERPCNPKLTVGNCPLGSVACPIIVFRRLILFGRTDLGSVRVP